MKETIWILARIFIALFAVFTISNSDAATVRKVETSGFVQLLIVVLQYRLLTKLLGNISTNIS